MLKKITFIVIILVFAKPAYDIVQKYLQEEINLNNVAILPASQQVSENSIVSNHEDNLESNAELPKIVSNKEQLADAFYYYFSHYEEQFTIQYSGNTSTTEKPPWLTECCTRHSFFARTKRPTTLFLTTTTLNANAVLPSCPKMFPFVTKEAKSTLSIPLATAISVVKKFKKY